MKDYSQIEKALPQLHKEYRLGQLERADLSGDPVAQFTRWLEDAVRKDVARPDAMVLSTASASGKPSARVVLLKGCNAEGFVFYTNYTSPKAKDLAANPRASVLFFWPELERQVRIDGRVKKLSAAESKQYFDARSDEAKLASLSSAQSRVIEDRAALEEKLARLRKKYKDQTIPFPSTWGGYRLVPKEFEFWQGRAHRLNDRFRYRLKAGTWIIERLQP